MKLDHGLRSFHQTLSPLSDRPSPADTMDEAPLSTAERKLSANLMRINHCGEVCAQALYLGQSLTARDPQVADTLTSAAKEEIDHLAWCQQRLMELNSHSSYLNPFWFIGSLTFGTLAGIVGDKWSLGFLAETEKQVSAHLASHLKKLPVSDEKSRAIVAKMQAEEEHHALTANQLGAATLPIPIQYTMRYAAKLMTTLVFYI